MHTATVATALLLAAGLATPPAMGATAAQAPKPTGNAAQNTQAQAPTGKFEGNVTLRVTTERSNGPQKVGVAISGDRVRYDLPPSPITQNQPESAIVDMATKQVLLVMPAQRSYAVLDMNTIPPQSKQATEQRLAGAAGNWTAAPTGTTKSLAGYACNQWQATNVKSSTKIDACLAPGVRVDFDKLLPASMLPASWADKLRNGELPLSATVYDASGKPTFTAQVTSVTPRAVPASDFAPPAGYKRVELPMGAFGRLMPSTR